MTQIARTEALVKKGIVKFEHKKVSDNLAHIRLYAKDGTRIGIYKHFEGNIDYGRAVGEAREGLCIRYQMEMAYGSN